MRRRQRPLDVEVLEDRLTPTAAFAYDIIAKTGSGLTSIGAGASANDYDQTAFVASTAAGQSVYTVRGTGTPVILSFAAPSATRTYGAEVQVNNSGGVAAVDNLSGSSPNPQRRSRIWNSVAPGTFTEYGRSSTPAINSTYFDGLGFNTSLSNDGKVSVAGLTGSFWEIHAASSLIAPGNPSTLAATVTTSTFFRSLIADGGRTALGWRDATTKRVTGFNTSGTAFYSTSTASGWTDLGVRPGISDDGRAMAFYGADVDGPGVFFALCPVGGTATVRRVTGVSGNGKLDPLESFNDLNSNGVFDPGTETDTGLFSAFSADTRIAVEHSAGATGKDIYTLAFLGTPVGGGTALYTVQVNALSPNAIASFQPFAVIGVGTTVSGLGGSVQSISISDPLNANGDITFVVDNGGGVQAVLRAHVLDSDGDGLPDTWETNGIDLNGDGVPEINLPAMGADPLRKDLFVEIDAMSGLAPLPAVSSYAIPASLTTNTVLDGVVDAFYRSPVANPTATAATGGPTGINLHVQVDETNVANAAWGSIDASKWPAEFDVLKTGRFGTPTERQDPTGLKLQAKRLAFRYAVFAKSFLATSAGSVTAGISGIAEIGGNDFIVSLGDASWQGSPNRGDDQAGTFMHEFGHTLGLHHGGDNEDNYKPNYRSQMNYLWQTPEPLPTTPSAALLAYHDSWRLDYSRGTRNTLAEALLSEANGIGGSPGVFVPIGKDASGAAVLVPERGPADFNRNGFIDTGTVSADVNAFDGATGATSTLTDHDDWSTLQYDFRRSRDAADGTHSSAGVNEVTNAMVTSLSNALQLVADAHVSAFQVNDGTAQRSRVTSLRITFDTVVPVTISNFAVTGFADGINITTNVSAGHTIATLTFSGATTEYNSLADGRYILNVAGIPGLTGTTAFNFHRLFGDSDGDADVDLTDLAAFRQTFATTAVDDPTLYNIAFDFDGDGDVDLTDLFNFRDRFGTALP